MQYTEKEIEELRKAALLKNKHSIYDNYIYIHGERLEFIKQDIYCPQVRMMLPKTFLDLPEALAKQMYPSEYRPSVMKTNPSMTVNFAFTYFNANIEMDEVATCAQYYLSMMKRMYPGNRYLESSEHFMDEERTSVLGWYSFSNPALDGDIYNIHAFTSVEKRLLYCIFHTAKEGFEEWKPFALEAFNSITSGREKGGELR